MAEKYGCLEDLSNSTFQGDRGHHKFINIECDRVRIWIKRVNRENSQSSSKSELEQISNYARQEFWYDALNILISSKSSRIVGKIYGANI